MSSLRSTLQQGRGGIFTSEEQPDQVLALARDAGWQVYDADVSRARDKAGLMRAVAAIFDLSGDFGYNWDAFSDVLRDLDHLPGVLVCWRGDAQLPERVQQTAYEVLADRAEDTTAPFVAVVCGS